MTALYIVPAILALIALLLAMRVGIVLEYSEEGFLLEIIAGSRSISIYPRELKEKKAVKEKKPAKRPAQTAPKKGGRMDAFKDIWVFIKKIIIRLRHKFRMDELIIHSMVAGENPVAVALLYGGVSAAMGMIIPLLEQNFNIKKRDIQSTFSFEFSEPRIFFRAKLTMAVWQVLYVGLPAILDYMKLKRIKEDGKEEK